MPNFQITKLTSADVVVCAHKRRCAYCDSSRTSVKVSEVEGVFFRWCTECNGTYALVPFPKCQDLCTDIICGTETDVTLGDALDRIEG